MEMRTDKFMIYVFSAIMLGGMVACSSDDPETDTGNGNGNGGNAEAPYVWGAEGAIKTCDHLLFDDDKTENAKGADNYGVEVDIRKNLDFIGMRNFSLSLNGALIKSKVKFEPGAKEKDRPMQGQSPYLINAGFFYQHADSGWNAALLYNRIGKRIIGVGRSLGTADNEVRVPDSYEMPRNAVDLSVSKKIGNLEIKVAVRDLLAEKVSFKQFEETRHGKVEQITRQYKSGRNFNLNINYTF